MPPTSETDHRVLRQARTVCVEPRRGGLRIPCRLRLTSNRKTGFTLIELLTVVLVIAILASIAIGRFQAVKIQGYIGQMKSDLGTLRIAEEGYWAENQGYSVDTTLLDWNSSSDVTVSITSSSLLAGYDVAATHAAVPAFACKMYVGRAMAGRPSGEIACQ